MPVDETKLELALADLCQQLKPNFKGTAILHNVNRTTLRRRFLGHQQSILNSRSETSRRLSNDMEKILIDFINRLTEHSLPPTSQIVKNIAEELCNMSVGKNWVGQFTHRHKGQLHAGYLRSIDSKRLNAENEILIQKFYDQVSFYLCINSL
jgi:Tc5 transposase DNA-binding domain